MSSKLLSCFYDNNLVCNVIFPRKKNAGIARTGACSQLSEFEESFRVFGQYSFIHHNQPDVSTGSVSHVGLIYCLCSVENLSVVGVTEFILQEVPVLFNQIIAQLPESA